MDFTISVGFGGWIVVILAALAFGVIAQFIGDARTGYEWLIDAIAFAIGAIVASEFIVGLRTFEPVYDGLALVPALVGGLAFGTVVEVVTRYLTGGHYTGHTMSA
jgi:uncharacterized membrane protein YeaQ/YmgE (transglycosylase-associated protein family)